MKKIILTLVVTLFAFAAFANDMPIQPNQLPANAHSFVASKFAGATIVAAKKDRDSYEAALSNGTKIDSQYNGIDLTNVLQDYFVSKEEFNTYKTSVTSLTNNLNSQLVNINTRLSQMEDNISLDIEDKIENVNQQINTINNKVTVLDNSLSQLGDIKRALEIILGV